jgi:hypothetical protein
MTTVPLEDFEDISLTNLYDNYLKPLDTEWFNTRKVVSKKAANTDQQKKPKTTILTVWKDSSSAVYKFSLQFHTSLNQEYTYDFYSSPAIGQARNKNGPTNRVYDNTNALEKKYSAAYVYYIARRLSLYVQDIELYALYDLDEVVRSKDGVPSSAYNELVPSLFYRNLLSIVTKVGGAVKVVPPPTKTRSGVPYSFDNNTLQYRIAPVYGPVHQPLIITSRNGHEYRVFFGNAIISKFRRHAGEQANKDNNVKVVPIGLDSGNNVLYDVLAFVEDLAQWIVKGSPRGHSIDTFFEAAIYRVDEDRLGRLHAEAVSSVIDLDILYAIKSAQLYLNADGDESSNVTDRKIVDLARDVRRHTREGYVKMLSNGGGDMPVDDSVWLQENVTVTLYNLYCDLKALSSV